MKQIFFVGLILYLLPCCSFHNGDHEDNRAIEQSQNESEFFNSDTIYQIAFVEPANFDLIKSLVCDAVEQANEVGIFLNDIEPQINCIQMSFRKYGSDTLCIISFRNLTDIITNGDKTDDIMGYTLVSGYKIIVRDSTASKYFQFVSQKPITVQPSPCFIDDSMPIVYKIGYNGFHRN